MDLPWIIQPGLAVTIGLLSFGIWKLYRLGHRSSSLPPGPPTVPILGNLPVMPKKYAFLQMTEWAREYGEIFSLVGGPTGTIIVLTSPRAIYEIMEKQAPLTADRTQTIIAQSVFGGLSMGTSNYTPYWKMIRRLASEILKPKACNDHTSLLMAESRQLMFDTLRSPEELYKHIQRVTISTIMSLVYGQRAPRFSSPFIKKQFELSLRMFATVQLESAQTLQMFPMLRFLPERWAPWKASCRALKHDMLTTLSALIDATEQRTSRGQLNGCYLESVLETAKELGMSRLEVCYFTWSLMNGGSVTMAAWIHFFVMCMTAHPEVQAKAQAEIARVVGNERMPEPKDMDSLPYVQAVIKEVSRFRPAVPMCQPHVASADIVYDKYRIPSGSVLVPNVWGVFRDETLFKDPDAFDPERYLKSPLGLREGVDVDDEAFKRFNVLAWGCGRRICPGIYLAQLTITINVMNLLWGFNFEKRRSPADGTEIEVDLWGFTSSSIVDAFPFVFQVTPRSPAHAEIIENQYVASTEVFEKFERELDPEDLLFVNKTRSSLS